MRREMGDGRWNRHRLPSLFRLFPVILLAACARTPATPSPARIPPPQPAPAPVIPVPEPGARLPDEGTIAGGAGGLWYHIRGTGRDTVIVPLGTWLEPSLAPLGTKYTVVFYDPRHRGRSHVMGDSVTATFDGDVADLEAVRLAVGAPRVAVIGYDYYAGVAAAWAARHSQAASRLVLLSPIEPAESLAMSYNPPERMARIDTLAARALVKARAAGRDTSEARAYCEQFWRVNAPLFVGDTANAGAIRTDWCQWPNESPPRLADAASRALASLGPGVDIGARAANLGIPTLVIQGRQDFVANPEGAREWARRIAGARILWLSNVGHVPFLEAGPVVLESIQDFLDGRWPPRAGPP